MNTYGTKFRLTTFGESHGTAVGGVIDGCPAGILIDEEAVRQSLMRRKEGAPRQEEDGVQWLSGLKDMITLGTPIAFLISNSNVRSHDYDAIQHCFRPGHADYTYYAKYGLRDHRGGGRASARETVARVVAGCIARQLMPEVEIRTQCHLPSVQPANDTTGGIIECALTGVPAGIGDPLFGKLSAALAEAMFSIPSVIGFEMGAGFAAAQMTGSEYIDRWDTAANGHTLTNHCGGIQGGITNGMPIQFRVAFHPVATLPVPVECLTEDGSLQSVDLGGRHDRNAVGRAAVIVESMAALCLINYLL